MYRSKIFTTCDMYRYMERKLKLYYANIGYTTKYGSTIIQCQLCVSP